MKFKFKSRGNCYKLPHVGAYPRRMQAWIRHSMLQKFIFNVCFSLMNCYEYLIIGKISELSSGDSATRKQEEPTFLKLLNQKGYRQEDADSDEHGHGSDSGSGMKI